MLFNNSILDNSFILPNYDDSNGAITFTEFQNSPVDLRNEFSLDFFRALFQNSKPEFIIEIRNSKRGRPSKVNKRKREHSSSSTDNMINKIQTHFLNFFICFINDIVKGYYRYQKYKFAKFDHKQKSKISYNYIDSMKNSTIGDLIRKMNISPKFKCSKDHNINNLNQLDQIPFFENLFKIKYLDLFSKYYNNKQPLKELLIEDKKINFSTSTKSFYELLQKKHNLKLKDNLINVAENFYLNENNLSNSDDIDTDI